MSGQVHVMIDRLISERSKGNPTIVQTTKTKLILKGIDPDKFDSHSTDDPAVIARLRDIADEMGMSL